MISISSLYERARTAWVKQSHAERKNTIKMVTIIGIICIFFGFYYLREGDAPKRKEAPPEPVTLVSENFLDRDLDARIEAAVNAEIARRLAAGTLSGSTISSDETESETGLDDLALADEGQDELDSLNFGGADQYANEAGGASYPEAPYTPVQSEQLQQRPQGAPQFRGGIKTVKLTTPPPPVVDAEITRFPVPPGFMPAMMIVGVHSQVSNSGTGNPKPIHLRVQAPATLPNKIKMDLAGCFVIANTWGNLASERIEAQTVSINCVTSDKKKLITGALKGYVADEDGQRDIAGRVVTKAGALMGRQFLAETMAGIGETIAQNTGDVAVSPLGTVTSVTGDELLKRGVTSGIGGGFKAAADYLSELLSQSGPVIESGAARPLMIMVQETSWLEIIDIEDAGKSGAPVAAAQPTN